MDKYERERYERRKARLEKKKRENRRRVLIMLSVILVLAGVLFFLLNRRQTKVFFGEETKMMCQIPVQYSLIEERTVDQTLVQQLIQDYYDRQLNSRFKVGSAYITDDAGHVLFELNAHERTYPASTTKLMTTILALEHTQDLDAWIEVQDLYGCYDDPDSMLLYIQEGDRIPCVTFSMRC